jgi:hypothetical protein
VFVVVRAASKAVIKAQEELDGSTQVDPRAGMVDVVALNWTSRSEDEVARPAKGA